ncbi:MAG: phosphotransferase family protein [Betaproteobacteria bacterium]|nr:phosphotransferase family protein [Betaproteobacteria bacterium]
MSAPAPLNPPDTAAITAFLREAAAAKTVRVSKLQLLSGGAIQQNWQLDVDIEGGCHAGKQQWVLRTDAPATVAASLPRSREYAILRYAHAQGLMAPQPYFLCTDAGVIGRPFFVMQKLPGVAAGHRVVRMELNRRALARELAQLAARIHAIKAPQTSGELPFLKTHLARDVIAACRAYLDTLDEPHPVLEWGLRWCERRAPQNEETTLVHRDFRTGNYLMLEGRVTGLLDWEFASLGNPLEDIGWICAKCWCFRHEHHIVGGVADLDDFIPAYEAASGRKVAPDQLRYWQVMAHMRWAIIALQQGERHLSGLEPSLELALTAKIVAELEWEVLLLTDKA